jgi:methyl-accepting chemotaxis protein
MRDKRPSWDRAIIDLILGFAALVLLIVDEAYPGYYLVVGSGLILIFFMIQRLRMTQTFIQFYDMLRRAVADREVTGESDFPPSFGPLVSGLEELVEEIQSDARNTRIATDTLRQLMESAEESIVNLGRSFSEQTEVTEQATLAMKEMSGSLKKIASNVEVLAESASEGSSSILEMTATNEEVANNMVVMSNSVKASVESIGEMARSVKEVADNIDALSASTEETSSAIGQMAVSIDQVQSNADENTAVSGEVAKYAERGAEAIAKTIESINKIKDSSQVAVEVISSLGKKIDAIGHILNVIDEVAEQTNLLALNAAIIAAQAGEHGRGFAVVADEIKELAERSGVSTKEIADLIKAIQSESRNAIAAVEQGNANVDGGVDISAQAEQALRKILESAQHSANMMRNIAKATVEQSRGSKQVTDAIGRIAETVQQIAQATQEQARGSELIIKGAEKMRSITQHVERSTAEQAKGGRQITKAIESISKMVTELNESHRMQKESIEKIAKLSSNIDRISEGQEQSLNQVRLAFDAVKEALKMSSTE